MLSNVKVAYALGEPEKTSNAVFAQNYARGRGWGVRPSAANCRIGQAIHPNDAQKVGLGVDRNLSKKANHMFINDNIRNFGAPIRIRTRDPLITNQVLYQLSYKGSSLQISAGAVGCKGVAWDMLSCGANQQRHRRKAHDGNDQGGGGGFTDALQAGEFIDSRG